MTHADSTFDQAIIQTWGGDPYPDFSLPGPANVYSELWRTINRLGPNKTLRIMEDNCSSHYLAAIVFSSNHSYARYLEHHIRDTCVNAVVSFLSDHGFNVEFDFPEIGPMTLEEHAQIYFMPPWLDPIDGLSTLRASIAEWRRAKKSLKKAYIDVEPGDELPIYFDDDMHVDIDPIKIDRVEKRERSEEQKVEQLKYYLLSQSKKVGPKEVIEQMLLRDNLAEMISFSEAQLGVECTGFRTELWRVTFRVLLKELEAKGIRPTYCPELRFWDAIYLDSLNERYAPIKEQFLKHANRPS